MKNGIIVAIPLVALLVFASIVSAVEKTDIVLDPFEEEGEKIVWAYEGDPVKITITSDNPINVYILTSSTYLSNPKNYSDPAFRQENVTSISFTYTIPDDQTYFIVLYNAGNEQATVDLEYSDGLESEFEEFAGLLILFGAICGIIVAVIIVVIVIIILLAVKEDSRPRPISPYVPPAHLCPTCAMPIRVIQPYNSWYCDHCRKYL